MAFRAGISKKCPIRVRDHSCYVITCLSSVSCLQVKWNFIEFVFVYLCICVFVYLCICIFVLEGIYIFIFVCGIHQNVAYIYIYFPSSSYCANSAYTGPVQPFVTPQDLLTSKDRILRHVVDVSCDPNNPHNPLPIYSQETSCDDPCLSIPTPSPPPLHVTSISHLPTILPKESSEYFSGCLIDSLLKLPNGGEWERALGVFKKKVEEAKHS